jgi:hypothetical protein
VIRPRLGGLDVTQGGNFEASLSQQVTNASQQYQIDYNEAKHMCKEVEQDIQNTQSLVVQERSATYCPSFPVQEITLEPY